jgi:hypothetical protein
VRPKSNRSSDKGAHIYYRRLQLQGTHPTVVTCLNTLLEFFIKILLENLDQALTLLISVTEEMDCNLGGTFVNLTSFGGNYQSLGG